MFYDGLLCVFDVVVIPLIKYNTLAIYSYVFCLDFNMFSFYDKLFISIIYYRIL